MSNSSILGGTTAPSRAPGSDVDRLGPSDSSDSGSDVQGELPMATAPDNPAEWGAITAETDSDSDASGTGERASAAGSDPRDGADIMPDRIIEAGGSAAEAIDPEVLKVLDSLADDAGLATADADDEDDLLTDEERSPRFNDTADRRPQGASSRR